MKKKILKIHDEIYNAQYYIFIGTHKQKEAYLHKVFKLPKSDQKYTGGENFMISYPDSSFCNFIWVNGFEWKIGDIACIAHELLHAEIGRAHV